MPPRAKVTKKRSAEGGKRYPLNMRTTFEMRQSLEAAAARSGRSLAQEAEIRIEHSFANEARLVEALDLAYGRELSGLMFAIGEAMKSAITAAGYAEALASLSTNDRAGQWWDSAYAYAQATEAAKTILTGLRPSGDPTPPATAAVAAIAAAPFVGQKATLDHVKQFLGEKLADIGVAAAQGIFFEIALDEAGRIGPRLRQALGKLADRIETAGR
jgi:hypothetical protein